MSSWGTSRILSCRIIAASMMIRPSVFSSVWVLCRVRLIGMDTPEAKHPRKPVPPFGKEASVFIKRLVEGKEVRLEFDVQRRDTYRRLLAYVYIGEQMLNAELVRQSSAQVATFPPSVKSQELFLSL